MLLKLRDAGNDKEFKKQKERPQKEPRMTSQLMFTKYLISVFSFNLFAAKTHEVEFYECQRAHTKRESHEKNVLTQLTRIRTIILMIPPPPSI